MNIPISENIALEKMLQVIMEAAQGNYNVQTELSGTNDSFDALAMGINMMIDDIRIGVEKIESERDFTNNVISSVADIIVVTNSEGKIILLNKAGTCLLSYEDSNQVVGMDLQSIFQDPLFNNAHSDDKYIVKNVENRIITKEGVSIPVLFSTSVLKDKQGNPSGIIGIARDITDKKKGEEKVQEYLTNLEKMNRELDQFAYVVSHDLKAPLRAIANLSQWIEEDLGTQVPDDVKKNMNTLRGRVYRMEALINGILSYSRSTRSKVEITRIDMHDMLHEIVDSFAIPPKYKVDIGGMPTLYNNKVWIEQIFSNLISNAIKHNDKEYGCIEISYIEEGNYYRFTVADNGPGIAPEYHQKVFAIFQTLEARDKVENTGVGLSIVKKIIEEQKGSIWIESQVGIGASFVFLLPKEYKPTTL